MEVLIDEPATAWQYPRFKLSFRPFVQYLKDHCRNVSSATMDQLYTYLIDQFEEAVAQTDLPDAVQSPNRLHDFFHLFQVCCSTGNGLPWSGRLIGSSRGCWSDHCAWQTVLPIHGPTPTCRDSC